MRKEISIVFVLLLMSVAGFAQIPTAGNVFFGYSLNHGNQGDTNTGTLNGWEASVEGKVIPYLGIVADVSAQYGTLSTLLGCLDPNCLFPVFGNESVRVENYLVGPRISFPIAKFRPFFHILIGASHLHESDGFSYGETDFSDAVGGGVDYKLIPRVGVRAQLDNLNTRFHGTTQNNTRFSTGLVVSF